MILVIDNYDSFVHNLARYFRLLGCETVVVRNDRLTIESVNRLAPTMIVISPGPGKPDQAGCSIDIVRAYYQTIPLLGICLGHQAIVQALGGTVCTSGNPVHGQDSEVFHTGSSLFQNVPSPFQAGRYHSLIASKENLPPDLRATAWTLDQTVMAVEHRQFPVVGLQFHPESILTPQGLTIVENFLNLDRQSLSISGGVTKSHSSLTLKS